MASLCPRCVIRLFVFFSCVILASAGRAQKAPVYLKRTYYDYRRQQLHEEYQIIRTANKLEVKNGYYREYSEEGVIKARATYRNDELNGVRTTYENWGHGPEPFEVDTYKNGLQHGYTALWWFNADGQRLKAHEGRYYEGEYDGRWVQYDQDGSKLVENWRRGVRNGETVQYGTTGEKVREGYFDEGELFTGTVEERFDNGTLRRSVAYEACFREGPTQTYYPNGQLKTWTRYSRGQPAGPTRHYLENGTPDAATKAALAESEAALAESEADSVQVAHQALALQHRQDSVRKAAERIQALAHQRQDSIDRVIARAQQGWIQERDATNKLLASAQAKQQEFANASLPEKERSSLYNKLTVALYDRLWTDYQVSPDNASKRLRAHRLLRLMELAEAFQRGEQPELSRAIRKEKDLNKILALAKL